MLRSDQLDKMMAEFESLPSRMPSRTLMEIAGYPHYENVCSNILAFYLDPAAEHGLKDLLLRALMICLGIEWPPSIKRADVDREVYSEQRGRLDILIETEGFVVGIENKIWAGLGNDLHDYRYLISSRAAAKQMVPDSIHYVVLSSPTSARRESIGKMQSPSIWFTSPALGPSGGIVHARRGAGDQDFRFSPIHIINPADHHENRPNRDSEFQAL